MAEGTRSALIVANDDYTDPGLRQLRAPASDAQALAAVLRDPAIGGFEVRTLLNAAAHEVNLAVEEFFADRRADDLLLVHFSCHGVKDEAGELYFATSNTLLRRLGATAVAADFVNRRMSRSRSRRVVLLLDCCYAGAFERGMTARAGSGVGIEEQFGGRGRAVITASSAMEYAFEGDELADTRELAPSVFTSALVQGLETGDADRDQDGLVALDELYDYVYDKVREATPNQTPGKWTFAVQGDLYIARRARPVSSPAPLPPELQDAINHPLAAVRAGAVQELARLLQSRHAGLALAARLAMERLTEDDSRAVAAAATAALNAQPPPAAQPLPPESVAPESGAPEPLPSEPVAPEPVVPKPVPPRLALSATVVDFGRLPERSKSPDRRVWLGNAGGGTLNARAATQSSWLELREVGDELVVAVDTSAIGEHDGVVTVDSDGGSATIRVQARVDPAPVPAREAAETTRPAAEPPPAERDRPVPQNAARTEAVQEPAPAAEPGGPVPDAAEPDGDSAPTPPPSVPPVGPATLDGPSTSEPGHPPGKRRRRRSRKARIVIWGSVGLAVIVVVSVLGSLGSDSGTGTGTTSLGEPPPASSTPFPVTGRVIFRDDFSSRANGWPNDRSKRIGGSYYSNGAYRIYADPAIRGGGAAASPPLKARRLYPSAPSNLLIEVTASSTAASYPDVGIGIFCRSTEIGKAYVFFIWSNYVAIAKVNTSDKSTSDDYVELKRSGNLAVSAASGMQAECATVTGQRAVRLVLAVNGQQLVETTDTDHPLLAGTVGLVVAAGKNAVQAKKTVEAEFDNFTVRQVSGIRS